MGSTRPGRGGLGVVLVERAAADVDARLADSHCPPAQIDIIPTQARDFTASQAGKRKVPRPPIAILGDPAQNGAHLVGGEGLEFPGLARYAIDQSGNVSRQASFGDQLREHL
jgi:hypothetical protein